MKCSICHKEIEKVGTWTQGNNAQPINNGRCCNTCDTTIVMPARLMQIKKAQNEVLSDIGFKKNKEAYKKLGGK